MVSSNFQRRLRLACNSKKGSCGKLKSLTPCTSRVNASAMLQESEFNKAKKCIYALGDCCRNLQLLKEAGAEIIFFSPLKDKFPQDVSGLYIGGGYPELHADELSERSDMRDVLRAFANAGGVVYAECGGLLYLSQSIQPLHEKPVSMGKVSRTFCETLLVPRMGESRQKPAKSPQRCEQTLLTFLSFRGPEQAASS